MMDKYLENLNSNIQELINLASTQSAYVSKPLLRHVLQWVELDRNAKKAEVAVLKSALIEGLDVDFTGTQYEVEWHEKGKVCNCSACYVARKCIADIDQILNLHKSDK